MTPWLIVLIAILSSVFCKGGEIVLWKERRSRGERLQFRNERQNDILDGIVVDVDFNALRDVDIGTQITFSIAGEMFSCKIQQTLHFIPNIQAKEINDFRTFSCRNEDGELQMSFHPNEADSFHGTLIIPRRRTQYIDSMRQNSSLYVVYDQQNSSKFFDEEEIDPNLEAINNIKMAKRIREDVADLKIFKFRILIIAHAEYSAYFGNKLSKVIPQIVALITRINEIYSRELGIFFELVYNFEDAICLKDNNDSFCDELFNHNGVRSQASEFLRKKGFDYDSYDLAHVVTRHPGGQASFPSLCTKTNKAAAYSGHGIPYSDKFYVDLVAHEIGHQIFGAHSFRDCIGESDPNLMLMGATESGGGTSIMSYAGLCGSNNLQNRVDPFFSSLNLEQMRNYLEQVQEDSSCGLSLRTNRRKLNVSGVDSCQIPLGNSFQLKGKEDHRQESLFSWDRIDPGFEDFDQLTFGRFTTQEPSESTSRFVPNLGILSGNLEGGLLREALPIAPVNMTFRFTQRSSFEMRLNDTKSDVTMGQFAFHDTEISFINTPKLSFSTLTKKYLPDNLISGANIWLIWNPVDFETNVEVLISAKEELDWIKVGETKATKQNLVIQIPEFEEEEWTPIYILIRGSFSESKEEMEGCFFFDILKNHQVFTKRETLAPTAPTDSVFPTTSPTAFPTPTNNPTPFPSIFPTNSPTPFPSTPASFPTKYPVVQEKTVSRDTNMCCG